VAWLYPSGGGTEKGVSMSNTEVLLEVSEIAKRFHQKNDVVDALKPLSFSLSQRENLGIIGESGSGKSTLLKLLIGLISPTSGQVKLLGNDITGLRGKSARDIYRNMQMVFQNPSGSFNPRKKLRSSILENMRQLCPVSSTAEYDYEIDRFLEKVGISPELADRYPHNLSGGQCQRIAIVRALLVKPKILLCDEITSALDVIAQARVIDLLLEMGRELEIAILFVTHDLSLASNFCENMIVLHQGGCVEAGNTSELICNPIHSYTKQLIKSFIEPLTSLEQKNTVLI